MRQISQCVYIVLLKVAFHRSFDFRHIYFSSKCIFSCRPLRPTRISPRHLRTLKNSPSRLSCKTLGQFTLLLWLNNCTLTNMGGCRLLHRNGRHPVPYVTAPYQSPTYTGATTQRLCTHTITRYHRLIYPLYM